jgi:hypothetical protein
MLKLCLLFTCGMPHFCLLAQCANDSTAGTGHTFQDVFFSDCDSSLSLPKIDHSPSELNTRCPLLRIVKNGLDFDWKV